MLFQGLDVLLLSDKFLPEARGFITAVLTRPLLLEFHLKIEVFNNEVLGSVQDQGEEEGETAEIHVSLGVEFSGLNFHTLGANCSPILRTVTTFISFFIPRQKSGFRRKSKEKGIRCGIVPAKSEQFLLHAVNTVDAVEEKDEDEDKANLQLKKVPLSVRGQRRGGGNHYRSRPSQRSWAHLHEIPDFGDDGALRKESEKAVLHTQW